MEYKIGSFNVQRWGFTAKKDFAKIAEIIAEENLDVVALQEIFTEGKGVEQFVKRELGGWDFCWAHPNESSDIVKNSDMQATGTRGEGYAFLWKKNLFKKTEYKELGVNRVFEPRIISRNELNENIDCTFFARTPYLIRLEPLYGGFFELRLIDVHIFYGNQNKSNIDRRRKEFEVLTQQIYPAINQRTYGNNRTIYTIAMGDYNLNIFRPQTKTLYNNCYLTEVYSYENGKQKVHILTVQDELTTLKEVDESNNTESLYANNFDHFTYSPELSSFSRVSYKAIDVVNKYCNGDADYYRKHISDHLPIVMTIEI